MSKNQRSFLFESRQGQGSLLAIAILGVLLSAFSWIASASLLNRKKEVVAFSRKLRVHNQEVVLQNLLRSPEYLNNKFFDLNKEVIRDWLTGSGNAVIVPEIVIVDPGIGEFETPRNLYGTGVFHQKSTLIPCPISQSSKNSGACPFQSSIQAIATYAEGIGEVDVKIKFTAVTGVKLDFPWNSELPENQLNARIPLNLFGVKISGAQISCKSGFQLLMLSQNPGELLCKIIQ